MTLTVDDVRLILNSQESINALSRKLGVSKQCISQVRLGRTHRSIAPELPRRLPAKTCYLCCYWRDGLDPCSQGIPDAAAEGAGFARDCDFYELRIKPAN